MATEVSTALWVDYALQYGGARRRAPGGGLLVRLARGVGKRRVGTAGLARPSERGERWPHSGAERSHSSRTRYTHDKDMSCPVYAIGWICNSRSPVWIYLIRIWSVGSIESPLRYTRDLFCDGFLWVSLWLCFI